MQYRKHNFYHNFTTAVGCDKETAWEILVNEINELVVDQPSKVIAILKTSGVSVSSNPSASKLTSTVIDQIYTNKQLRTQLVSLITQRHKDPYVNAGGSVYEKSAVDASEVLATANTLIDDKQPDLTKAAVQKMASNDLRSKQAQKGLKVGVNPVKFLFGLAVVSGVLYLGYKFVLPKFKTV
jgi:hypothetical protein